MNDFMETYEHYCTVLEKNIVIQRTIPGNGSMANISKRSIENICLNSYACECKGKCGNKLMDLSLVF